MKLSIFFFMAMFFGRIAFTEEILVQDSSSELFNTAEIVIGSEIIQNKNAQDFYSLINRGLFIESNSFNFISGESSLSFFGQGANRFLVEIDGLPQTSATGIGGARDLSYIDPFMFDDVALVFGGQGAMLGGQAFSGAIQLKRQESNETRYQLMIGNYGQQKIAFKNGKKNNWGIFGYSFGHRQKSGPSLSQTPRPENNLLENDQRQIDSVDLWWRPKNSVGFEIELKGFLSKQDFDQPQLDDDRPKSEEKQLELIIKNTGLLFGDKVASEIISRYQYNRRSIQTVYQEKEYPISYGNNSLYFQQQFQLLEPIGRFRSLMVGTQFNRDFILEISEMAEEEKIKLDNIQGNIFLKGEWEKSTENKINFSLRTNLFSQATFPQLSIGHVYNVGKNINKITFTRNHRPASNYERFSIYGNKILADELSHGVELEHLYPLKNNQKIKFIALYQQQENLILFDQEELKYRNLQSNTISSFGGEYYFSLGSFNNYIGLRYAKNSDKMFQRFFSPIKLIWDLEKQINNKSSVKINQQIYSPKSNYFGEKIEASYLSSLNYSYNLSPKLVFNAYGSFSFIKSDMENQLIELSLKGIL